MKQYKQLLRDIQQKGTYKSAAREGMPGTTSLFGYQFRHNLADGFPLLTTKQVPWKGVVIELLWFLKGDTNIKYLDENNVRYMWHEDAYNYYVKLCKQQNILNQFSFELFCSIIQNAKNIEELREESFKNSDFSEHSRNVVPKNYTLGDCGIQYGKLWRWWPTNNFSKNNWNENEIHTVDQIKDLIEGLKNNPMGRRHILTAWNPATLDDMALNACHAMAQWNCRPLTSEERFQYAIEKGYPTPIVNVGNEEYIHLFFDEVNIPKYTLDCQMYQRSADVFLGVPLNIASYALLTEILCKICNMIPGEMIYTYGDVHIYDNHKEQIELQLTREERELPTIRATAWLNMVIQDGRDLDWILNETLDFEDFFFILENYNPHPKISGKLSTGLK